MIQIRLSVLNENKFTVKQSEIKAGQCINNTLVNACEKQSTSSGPEETFDVFPSPTFLTCPVRRFVPYFSTLQLELHIAVNKSTSYTKL